MKNENHKLPRIAISVGDLNGIGIEIILKTFADAAIFELCTPILFASNKVVNYHKKALGMHNFNFHGVNNLDQIRDGKLNVMTAWIDDVQLNLGTANPEIGKYTLKSLSAACDAVDAGQAVAIVTAPIDKNSVQSEDFNFSGHTDYLEDRYESKAVMLLCSDEMRMALATVHIPLSEVASSINRDLLFERLRVLEPSLKADFGISKPRIALLALNPHAGDKGVIGTEDQDVVQKVVEEMTAMGKLCFGPYPSDSFFGSQKHTKFDSILAMYHDQGLVAFKSISFGEGVNYSAGLPIVRTSPDHGTAYDIAGKNQANPSSFRSAVFMAIDIARKRELDNELKTNPLKEQNKPR